MYITKILLLGIFPREADDPGFGEYGERKYPKKIHV